MSEQFSADQVTVAKMYYTLCMEPGCGAIDDFADSRAQAEKNRRAHIAWHKSVSANEPGPTAPTRREVEAWAAGASSHDTSHPDTPEGER